MKVLAHTKKGDYYRFIVLMTERGALFGSRKRQRSIVAKMNCIRRFEGYFVDDKRALSYDEANELANYINCLEMEEVFS